MQITKTYGGVMSGGGLNDKGPCMLACGVERLPKLGQQGDSPNDL